MHEREVPRAFFNPQIYRDPVLQRALEHFALSWRRYRIFRPDPRKNGNPNSVQRARGLKEARGGCKQNQSFQTLVPVDAHRDARPHPRLSSRHRQKHRSSDRMPQASHTRLAWNDCINRQSQPAGAEQQLIRCHLRANEPVEMRRNHSYTTLSQGFQQRQVSFWISSPTNREYRKSKRIPPLNQRCVKALRTVRERYPRHLNPSPAPSRSPETPPRPPPPSPRHQP